LECINICIILLIAIDNLRLVTKEVGFKYLIINAIGSTFLLVGIGMLYTIIGSTSFLTISEWMSSKQLSLNSMYLQGVNLQLPVVLIIIGVSTKIGIYPGALIVGDVAESVSAKTFIISNVIVKMGVLLVATRIVLGPFFLALSFVSNSLMILGILTTSIGVISALGQKKIMRLIGFDSMVQVSYLLFAYGTANQTIIYTALIYIYFYLVVVTAFILLIEYINVNENKVIYLTDLASLYDTEFR
jgi:NADH-quinone oxidoreductase subunit N